MVFMKWTMYEVLVREMSANNNSFNAVNYHFDTLEQNIAHYERN